MERQKIQSRADIHFLVSAFYKKVRADDLLGPIFNLHISDWPRHLETLTDFWETNLLFKRNYKGNPVQSHIEVDKSSESEISQVHFGRWLQLWFETIDIHFVGELSINAKDRARNMSTHLFMKMFGSRKSI